jgi:GST-like protein
MPTPNGKKVSIALEELELPYEPHRVDIHAGDQHSPEYLRINPNAKIPAIIDPNGPGGQPVAMMESGAILLYLAEKTGRLIPQEPLLRLETIQWLFFQMASIGPMMGQFGHFHKFAKGKTDDYGDTRYTAETKRLLRVLDTRLEGRQYLVGEQLTIADIATVPWMQALDFYEGKTVVEYDSFINVVAWADRVSQRPAYLRGAVVNDKAS